jgi:hypothetical protein
MVLGCMKKAVRKKAGLFHVSTGYCWQVNYKRPMPGALKMPDKSSPHAQKIGLAKAEMR